MKSSHTTTEGEEASHMCSSGAAPPSFEEISLFMATYSAKLAKRISFGVPPYLYSGTDYGLVLHLCGGSSIHLSDFCWSTSPLAAQRQMNLNLFCQAALSMGCADTPVSSLQPSLLQPIVSCLWHHLRVQQWLSTLPRHPIPGGDASLVRLHFRQRQLGEPFPSSSPLVCSSLSEIKAFDSAVFALCAPYLQALGPSSPSVPQVDMGEEKGPEAPTDGKKSKLPSYSKPWNAASVDAAKAKKAKREAAIKQKVAAARQTGQLHRKSLFPAASSSPTGSSMHLGQQLMLSARTGKALREGMCLVRQSVYSCVLRGEPIDFSYVTALLDGLCGGPSPGNRTASSSSFATARA